MMRNPFNFKIWPTPDPHLDAVESCTKPSDSNCEAPLAQPPAHTEASSNLAEDVSMTEYNPFVEEPQVQPSYPAGNVRFISQNGPRTTKQDQHRPMNKIRNKNKRLSKTPTNERAESQELASKLLCSEEYNGRLQMELAAHEKSSQPREEIWIDLSTAKQDKKVMQEEATLRKELQAQKESLKEVQSHLKAAVKAAQVAREELAARQQQVQAFEAELRRMRDNEQDLNETREELAASQQELRACKDDLFRLQPVAQATDADISRDFESLCQRINDWIEGEMSSFEDTHPDAKPEQMFSDVGSPELIMFMQEYQEIGEYLVRTMIHHHLQEIMFDRDVYLFGIPLDLARMLHGAEQSMAMLEPRREDTTIDIWRSETLTALSAYEEFANQRRRRLDEASRHIFKMLSSVFPIITMEDQSFVRFFDRIMFPAAELASKIQSSASTYEFVMLEDMFTNLEPLHIDHLAGIRMIEVKTRKTLKSKSKVISDSHGFIGEVILALEPSLHRKNRGQDSTTLYQACYLVELDKPLLK